jgi:uncharacterized repeat protein (TIGR03843 family)
MPTAMPAPGSTDPVAAARLRTLVDADLVIEGRMPWSSNATFLCELWPAGSRPDAGLAERSNEDGDGGRHSDDDDAPDDDVEEEEEEEEEEEDGSPSGRLPGSGGPLGRAIYKPHQGERPLWDFPDGLYVREAAAYDLSCAVGWDCIPPTIVRDGPFGAGSVQWFIDADFDRHHFILVDDEAFHEQLRRMCAFDIVANSTDRKAGHVLVDPDDHLWGIDNGLSLHAEFKLRTVIWEFAAEPLPADLAEDLCRFLDRPLPDELAAVLDPFERDAIAQRARALVSEGHFPVDHTGRRYPWPLV